MGIFFAFALMIAALVSTGGAAHGDQNDPRMPGLFELLLAAPDSESSWLIERQIWAIWSQNGDRRINHLMEAGSWLLGAGSYDRAFEVFDRITVDAPEFSEGWNKRATVLYLLRDYAASVRDIQQTLALEPRHFGALSGLGLIYRAIGKPESALRVFRKTLEIHPQSASAKAHIEALRDELEGFMQ